MTKEIFMYAWGDDMFFTLDEALTYVSDTLEKEEAIDCEIEVFLMKELNYELFVKGNQNFGIFTDDLQEFIRDNVGQENYEELCRSEFIEKTIGESVIREKIVELIRSQLNQFFPFITEDKRIEVIKLTPEILEKYYEC